MRELQIQCPDGQTKTMRLEGNYVSLGRAAPNGLCFPDDSGLSRVHLSFEREGETWRVRDLGSKNGTLLNGSRLSGRHELRSGDRISAGHIVITYHDEAKEAPSVIFVEGDESGSAESTTVVASLEGLLANEGSARGSDSSGGVRVSALLHAMNELAGNRPLPELFPLILNLSIQGVGAHRGVLMTLENGKLVVAAHQGEGFRISTAVRERVLETKMSVLVRDAQVDAAFRERQSIVEQSVRTLMAVPLQTQDRIIGLIYVDSPSLLRKFTKGDLNLLTAMANVAANQIEHARLLEVEVAEREQARELDRAAEIQRRFLPGAAPSVYGLDLAGHNAPSRAVGGDYYDFFPYPNGRVGLVLGDVAGKGMSAALLMMSLQASVQVMAEEPEHPAEVITRLNRIVGARSPSNRFISFFFCIVDPATGTLVYCNAGHNPPFIVRVNGELEELKEGGAVLGIFPAAQYQEVPSHLDRGDVFFAYSDGITESCSPGREEFGETRLAELLRQHRSESAQSILDAVNRAIADWTDGAPPADDVTMVVAKREPKSSIEE